MSPMDINKDFVQCNNCSGWGLVKMEAILCDCDYTFCMKCENNQGFKVKPYETCNICFGSGTIENKVINKTKTHN